LQKLRLKLSGADEQRFKKPQTENSEAYQLYLTGRYHLNRLTDEGFLKGREYFQQAIDKDPNYALAYVGLADSYNMLSGWNALPPKEGFPKARVTATKALVCRTWGEGASLRVARQGLSRTGFQFGLSQSRSDIR
jgi:hypothetical protein